jgi:chitodextrinase
MGPAMKTETSQSIENLEANTLYYFKVNMFTTRHGQNQNFVVSEDSEIVSATTAHGTPAWKAGQLYHVSDCVIYSNKTWKCTYAHTAQANWYPGAAGIWFWTVADWDGQWHSGVAYKVGDVVQYKGSNWQCTYAHTSQVDWYPGAPGLWFWKKI